MSDIYIENAEMANTNSMVNKLYEMYCYKIRETTKDDRPFDIDEHRRHTTLAIQFPNRDLIRQILKDAAALMVEYNINPKDIKW